MSAPDSMTSNEIFDSGAPNRCTSAIQSVQTKFVYPSTGAWPGFHSSPWPAARFRAYRIEIIASSNSVK